MQLTSSRRVFLAITLALCCPPVNSGIQSELGNLLAARQLLAPDSTRRSYEENGFLPQWSQDQITSLVTAMDGAREHGLDPNDYHFSELRSGGLDEDRMHILATDAYLAYAGHLVSGKVKPITMEPTWTVKGRERDLVIYLKESLVKDKIESSLDILEPQQPSYQILKNALNRYQQISDAGGWGTVPAGEVVKPGTSSPLIPALFKRLAATGDIPESNVNDVYLYSDELVAAIKRFQRRLNLEPDGIVGPATIKNLNLSPQYRVDQIRVNLERWRWLPEDLGNKHIRINIADYRLEAHEKGHVSRVHDVIVGRNYRKTPVFSANMTFLVLNPWWETPPKLARLDKLPDFQKSPQLVEKLGFQVLDSNGNLLDTRHIDWHAYSASNFPFRLRQKPGPNNALGKIKFMLPNKHNVYLHDTPSRDLFEKTRRDFSSGCIRVKDPIDLAEWVLRDDLNWPRNHQESTIATGKETRVILKNQIPVHFLYWTVVSSDDDNDVRFIEDIYDRDNRVLNALNTKPSRQ